MRDQLYTAPSTNVLIAVDIKHLLCNEDDGGSLYAATSVSSPKKLSAKTKNAKQITQTVKLLKLVIKKFGGNHARYQSFWDFKSVKRGSRPPQFKSRKPID